MELLHNLIFGFSVAFSLQNLLYCAIGVSVGTLIGVLPGIGPLATIAMLLPLTFSIAPVSAMIMLAGIYYGAQYGGSTAAILVNLPGETSAVVTCLDGHQMARQGRAGPALAIAAIGSFVAGTFGTMLIAVAGPPLAGVALQFGAPEYFSLMLMGLVAAAVLAQGDTIKSLAMVAVGLLLGIVGTDVNSGVRRFVFGINELADGIGFIVLAVGVFAIGEIVSNLSDPEERRVFTDRVKSLMPTNEDVKASAMPIVRGTLLGTFFGILPGTGPAIASFSSYMLEKKLAKDPSRFGKGAIEGVAGPEAANNADAQCKFIPMLTLGLPASGVMALMLGALTIQGIQPGPEVMTTRPELFWGLIASMWIGNALLVVLNLPMIGVWVKLLKVPYRLLFPAIMAFSAIGVYSVNNSSFEIYLAALFGVIGVVWIRLGCSPAPMLLGFVLGPMMEEHLRRAMLVSRGDPSVFLTRPISLMFIVATIGILAMMVAGPPSAAGRCHRVNLVPPPGRRLSATAGDGLCQDRRAQHPLMSVTPQRRCDCLPMSVERQTADTWQDRVYDLLRQHKLTRIAYVPTPAPRS
jgi:TctA family transporter